MMADETQTEATPEVESTETVENVEATPEVDAPEAPAQEEVKPHPAHEKLLNEIPEAWHQKVLPHLQEQDKYYQQEMEKYSPYKDIVESGISPEIVQGGINLAKAIETQPMDVYNSLTQYLKQQGLLAEEAKEAAKEIMEDESGEDFAEIMDGEELPAALKKELNELKEFKAQQEDFIYQQKLEKETQVELQKLESEMSELKSKYEVSDAHETALYDLMNAAINAGRDMSVAEAAKQLQEMVGPFQGKGGAPAEPAPRVVGSAGGAGIVAPDLEVPKNDEGKKEMLAKMFEEYKKAAQ
jgi:hypothetical protein